MTEYARVVDGNVMEFGPAPDAFQVPDAEGELVWVSTPADTPTDPKLLKKAGWLPVEDRYEKPSAENADSVYGEPGFEVMATKVVRTHPLVAPEAAPDPAAEHVTDIDQRLMIVEKLVEHYKPMIDSFTQGSPITELDARAIYAQVTLLRGEVAALRSELREGD